MNVHVATKEKQARITYMWVNAKVHPADKKVKISLKAKGRNHPNEWFDNFLQPSTGV